MTEQEIIKCLLGARTKLGAIVWGVLRDYHTTEDILQDVVVKALERKHQFENDRLLMAWARVSCRNAAIDICRQKLNRKNLLKSAALDALESDLHSYTSETLDAKVDALLHCIKSLPEKTRSIIQARYRDEQAVGEIAQLFGQSLDATYQVISRTHRRLRNCVERRISSSS